jgi:hypothetical protein
MAITPAELTGERTEVTFSGEIASTCFGGGGRFLILHVPSERQLVVFDVCQAKVVKTLLTGVAKPLFAAGMNSLVVVYPATKVIERWSLTTFEKEATAEMATTQNLAPCAVAMGSASNGPLLVQAIDYPRLGERFLYDITAMRVLDGTREYNGKVGAMPGNRLRASPEGRVFTIVQQSLRASVLSVSDGGVRETLYPWQSSVQPPIPSGDEETVYGPGNAVTSTGKRLIEDGQRGLWYLPAVHGPLFFSLANPKGRGKFMVVSVHAQRNERALFRLAQSAVDSNLVDRVFLVPDAQVLLVLPQDARDRLVLQRVDLDAELAKTGVDSDYLFVTSRPPPMIPGKRFEYPVAMKSKRGGVKFRLDAGPNGLAVSSDGKVSWDVPADLAKSVSVAVTVSDASGQEVIHSFELVPAAESPLPNRD